MSWYCASNAEPKSGMSRGYRRPERVSGLALTAASANNPSQWAGPCPQPRRKRRPTWLYVAPGPDADDVEVPLTDAELVDAELVDAKLVDVGLVAAVPGTVVSALVEGATSDVVVVVIDSKLVVVELLSELTVVELGGEVPDGEVVVGKPPVPGPLGELPPPVPGELVPGPVVVGKPPTSVPVVLLEPKGEPTWAPAGLLVPVRPGTVVAGLVVGVRPPGPVVVDGAPAAPPG